MESKRFMEIITTQVESIIQIILATIIMLDLHQVIIQAQQLPLLMKILRLRLLPIPII